MRRYSRGDGTWREILRVNRGGGQGEGYDPPGSRGEVGCRLARLGLRGGGPARGQGQGEGGAAVRPGARGDLASMLEDDFLHDGEPESGALVPRGEVGIEDALAQLRSDPGALVRDREHGPVALPGDAQVDPGARGARRVDGVAHQVREDAA